MQKKARLLLCLLAVLVCFSACQNVSNTDLKSDDPSSSDHSSVETPAPDEEKQQIICVESGSFGNQLGKCQVMLVTDNTDPKDLTTKAHLSLIGEDGKTISFEFGEVDKAAVADGIEDKIILQDIDGDSIDEIIVNFYATGNRSSIAYVLKLNDDSIDLMFDLNHEKSLMEETGEFVPLFECEFLENRKLRVYNDDISFSKEIDISHYSEGFFDENGVGTSDTSWVYCMHIDSCQINPDNKHEIFAECFIKLDSSIVGRIKMTYAFDFDSDTLKLTNAEIVS